MIKRFSILAALLVVMTGITTVQAQNKGLKNLKKVTVTGSGMTKEEALRDAMRKAVEKGAGALIYSESKTKDFVLVKDTVLSRATGFVQSHEVISENESEDGVWEIKIEAVVSVKGIEDTWGAVTTLLKQMGRPKIMVFITERIEGRNVESSKVQTRIENVLLKSGFILVNKEQLKAIDQKDLTAAIAEDKPDKVQAIAKRFGAQLFITGTATATAGEFKRIGGIPIYTYQTDANIKCFRSDTGQLLSSVPGAPTRGANRVWLSAANMSLDLQAKQVTPEVRADILQFWQDALAGRGEVKMEVTDISFKQYLALKKALKTVKVVKDVTVKYSNKVATCSIESSVNAETLAEAIMEVYENLEISDITQNVIKASHAE